MTHHQINHGNKVVGRIMPGLKAGGGYLVMEGDWGMVVGFGDTEESALASVAQRFDKASPLRAMPVSKALRRAVDPDDVHSLEFQVVRDARGQLLAIEPSEVS